MGCQYGLRRGLVPPRTTFVGNVLTDSCCQYPRRSDGGCGYVPGDGMV